MNFFKNCVQELGSHRSVIGLTVVFELLGWNELEPEIYKLKKRSDPTSDETES